MKNSIYYSHPINNLSTLDLNNLTNLHSFEINHLLNFLNQHQITKLSLQNSYQITLTLFNFDSNSLNILKIISTLTYLIFNNLTINSSTFNSLLSTLKINKNLFIIKTYNSNSGELTNIDYFIK